MAAYFCCIAHLLTNEDFSIVVNVLYMATISGVGLFHVCAAVCLVFPKHCFIKCCVH